MEPMNQMPPSPQMPPPPAPVSGGDSHVCGSGCWHSIVFTILILALVAGGVWWYMTQYQAPASLEIQENEAPSAAIDEDAALEAELEATNLDTLDQESASLEGELY